MNEAIETAALSPAMQAVMQHLTQQLPGMPARDVARFAASLTHDEPYAAWDGWRPVAGGHAQALAGSLRRFSHTGSRCYPGVGRSMAVYVPQQYDPSPVNRSEHARLMVFQDGERYLGPELNAVQVLDALIGAKAIPPVVAVFVEPGDTGPGLPLYGGSGNRSVEYDATGDTYVRFLLEELLPVALDGLAVRSDGAGRALVGLSSGGMCALNAALERPDAFGKVISHCGSFVDIRGGHQIAGMIRRGEGEPLRVFLQSGTHDLDISFGNWELANRSVAAALAYRGWDHQLVIGDGGHSLRHGGALFHQTLQWLWRPDD